MTTKDSCPAWATALIGKLREIEIRLGNIPESLSWQTDDLDRLAARSAGNDDDTLFDEEATEILFRKIVRDLAADDFASEEIVMFINSRIGYQGGPPYCSVIEVNDALSQSRA